jgi:uncharacterized protein YndB with AHSA1/START domain
MTINDRALAPGHVTLTTAEDGRSATATVDLSASPERVFDALASNEITEWWVRPGVFDTREWSGDVRPGGRWRGSGIFQGKPYTIEGEFLEVDPPRALSHTWHPAGAPAAATSTVSYFLEPIDGGTRVTLTHGTFASPEATEGNAIGWQTSFERLVEVLAGR